MDKIKLIPEDGSNYYIIDKYNELATKTNQLIDIYNESSKDNTSASRH